MFIESLKADMYRDAKWKNKGSKPVTLEVVEKTHSPIGASSCERWWHCPGSVILAKDIQGSGATVYSAEGTVAHTLGERCLTGDIGTMGELADEVGKSYVQDGFEIEVTEGMVEAVTLYCDTISEYAHEYGLRAAETCAEVKFALKHIDEEAFGTCDAVMVVPFNRIIVIDYKHGAGHTVDVENNYQLLYYALGAYYALPEHVRPEMAYVETVIIQPRAKHIDGPVRKHVYRIEELLRHEVELREAVKRVRENDATLKTGPHCRFCPAKAICPEIRLDMGRKAQSDFTAFTAAPVKLQPPSTFTPEQLATLINNADAVQSWARSIVAYGQSIAEKGVEIPGFKLVQKEGNRRWINAAQVESAFALEFGDDIFNKSLKSPAQMEKILKKRKDELGPYVERPMGAKTLVPDTDIRGAVGASALTDFGVFV